jgi:hypothetical protein
VATTAAEVGRAPPTRTNGPTTALAGSRNAPGKLASEREEQVATAGAGRVPAAGRTVSVAVRSASEPLPQPVVERASAIAPTSKMSLMPILTFSTPVAGNAFP